jgi:hypothetical protein
MTLKWLEFRCLSIPIALLLVSYVSLAAAPNDGWNNLKNSIRNCSYVVLSRDGRCTVGKFVSADEQSLQLQVMNAKGTYDPISLQRAQILRVSEDSNQTTHNTVFSGRSSWSDVKTAEPQASEYLSVITKQDQELKFKKPKVTDDIITVGRTTVKRDDIRFVSYVRFKSISDSAARNWGEAGIFVWPAFWIYQRMLPKISVLLYNSAEKQDDSTLECKANP